MKIPLPDATGRFADQTLRGVTVEPRPLGRAPVRKMFFAAHAGADPPADDQRSEAAVSNRTAAPAFHRHPTGPEPGTAEAISGVPT